MQDAGQILYVGQILHRLNENEMEGASIIILVFFYEYNFILLFLKV